VRRASKPLAAPRPCAQPHEHGCGCSSGSLCMQHVTDIISIRHTSTRFALTCACRSLLGGGHRRHEGHLCKRSFDAGFFSLPILDILLPGCGTLGTPAFRGTVCPPSCNLPSNAQPGVCAFLWVSSHFFTTFPTCPLDLWHHCTPSAAGRPPEPPDDPSAKVNWLPPGMDCEPPQAGIFQVCAANPQMGQISQGPRQAMFTRYCSRFQVWAHTAVLDMFHTRSVFSINT
jgi:hypothetical protein